MFDFPAAAQVYHTALSTQLTGDSQELLALLPDASVDLIIWFNPAKLPSPIEWVNKRKIRAKDAVNTVWWFSKTELPKADVTKVLAPYSERMKTLLKNPSAFYTPKERPSGHDIAEAFGKDNGGAIPSNLRNRSDPFLASFVLRRPEILF